MPQVSPGIPGKRSRSATTCQLGFSRPVTTKPMIAMPFHPSNTYTIEELKKNPQDILRKVEKDAIELTGNPNLNLTCKYHDGDIYVDSGNIGGCSGGCFENLVAAADILDGADVGNDVFGLTVYPDSQPTNLELIKNGAAAKLMKAGNLRTVYGRGKITR